MVLVLHGSPISTCTQRVILILKEKKVDFEFILVDFTKGEHKAPAFLEKQPFGQLPYLVDGEFAVYESRAICRYIAAKYADQGTPLIPTTLEGVAIFEQAASIEQNNFDSAVSGILLQKVFAPMMGLTLDEALLAHYTEKFESKLPGYEAILSKQKYLAGNEITLVDLFHLPHGNFLGRAGVDALESDKYPSIKAWWKILTEREAWKEVIAK